MFHSSLPYALVRDFAYPEFHSLHYGPHDLDPSVMSTPASEHQRRLSDPNFSTWEGACGSRGTGPWGEGGGGGQQLPQTSYDWWAEVGDGPPYSEDEDLQSPVVVGKSRGSHRKNKSAMSDLERGRRIAAQEGRGESTEEETPRAEYYDQSMAERPGEVRSRGYRGMLVDHPFGHAREGHEELGEGEGGSDGCSSDDETRYSTHYTFSIASPDEEFAGKAVALYDFNRENENELPLVEGQIILVSYRHGQGWLVAQDLKTGESGLVPEEYVRLVRDIQGGWEEGNIGGDQQQHVYNGDAERVEGEEGDAATEQSEISGFRHQRMPSGTMSQQVAVSGGGHYDTPVVSSFSTSTRDYMSGGGGGHRDLRRGSGGEDSTTPESGPTKQTGETMSSGLAGKVDGETENEEEKRRRKRASMEEIRVPGT